MTKFIMAIVLAFFFLFYLKALADVAEQVTPNNKGNVIVIQVLKNIFFGLVLCTLLTLLGITTFCFSDIFICTSLVLLIQSL